MKKYFETADMRSFSWILFLLAFFLYLRGYQGIRHDSILYFGQGLLHADPVNFSKDLFFAFGSQDRYTLFPELLSQLLQFGEIGDIFQYATFFCLTAWFFTILLLVRSWFPHAWLPALIGALLVSPFFGGMQIFSFSENFFTARSIADPLTILAIVLFSFGGRIRLFSSLPIGFAILVHPLQTLSFFAFAFFLLTIEKKSYWQSVLLSFLTISILFLVFPNIVDEEWRQSIFGNSQYIWIQYWAYQDFAKLAWNFFVIFACLRLFPSKNTQSVLCFFLIFPVVLFIEHFNWHLLLEVQSWRIFSFVQILAGICTGILAFHWWNSNQGSDWWKSVIVVTGTIFFVPANGMITNNEYPWLFFAVLAFVPVLLISKPWMSPPGRFLGIVFLSGLGIHAIDQFLEHFLFFQEMGSSRQSVQLDRDLLRLSVFQFFLLLLAFLIFKSKWIAIGFSVLVFVFSVGDFDRRTPYQLAIEKHGHSTFTKHIDHGQTVLWPEHMLQTWLSIGRPLFFDPTQLAGVVFNRTTAMEGGRRQLLTKNFFFDHIMCSKIKEMSPQTSCEIPEKAIQKMCKEEIHPDFFVGQFDDPRKIESWKLPIGKNGEKSEIHHLYACKDFR